MDQPASDPVEDKRYELEQLVLEKKRLLREVEYMQAQQQAYEENKPFFDKLIALHRRIEEMQRVKEGIIDKSATLVQLNEVLSNGLAAVESQVQNRDEVLAQLEALLQEVQEIIRTCSE